MKRVFLLLTAFILLFSSCGKAQSDYRYVHDFSPLVTQVKNNLDRSDLTALTEEEIEFQLNLDDDLYDKGFVLFSTSGASIDEFGIFLAEEGKIDSLDECIQAYVSSCQKNKKEWLMSYNPPEAEKLKNGKAFRFGNCVGYSFLSEAQTKTLLEEVESYMKNR